MKALLTSTDKYIYIKWNIYSAIRKFLYATAYVDLTLLCFSEITQTEKDDTVCD